MGMIRNGYWNMRPVYTLALVECRWHGKQRAGTTTSSDRMGQCL